MCISSPALEECCPIQGCSIQNASRFTVKNECTVFNALLLIHICLNSDFSSLAAVFHFLVRDKHMFNEMP